MARGRGLSCSCFASVHVFGLCLPRPLCSVLCCVLPIGSPSENLSLVTCGSVHSGFEDGSFGSLEGVVFCLGCRPSIFGVFVPGLWPRGALDFRCALARGAQSPLVREPSLSSHTLIRMFSGVRSPEALLWPRGLFAFESLLAFLFFCSASSSRWLVCPGFAVVQSTDSGPLIIEATRFVAFVDRPGSGS